MTANSLRYITSKQVRMARAGMRWTLLELAARSGVGYRTIHRFEIDQCKPRAKTLAAIRTAFEAAGVEFAGLSGVILSDD